MWGLARNYLVRFCNLQLTDTSRVGVAKLYRKFESLSLRHAVWTAEKLPRALPGNMRKMPVLAISRLQAGLERTDRRAAKGLLSGLFSRVRIRSPVSSRALGERNAIRSRVLSEPGLDLASRTSWITLRRSRTISGPLKAHRSQLRDKSHLAGRKPPIRSSTPSDNFWFARQPGAIAITSYKPTSQY